MNKLFLLTNIVTSLTTISSQEVQTTVQIQESHVSQSMRTFPEYVKKVKKQTEWFGGSFSFVTKKAARALGYDKTTLSFIVIVTHYFKVFGLDQNRLKRFLQNNREEIITYANKVLYQVTSNGVNRKVSVNALARVEHACHVDRLTTLSSSERQQVVSNPKQLVAFVRSGKISREDFYRNVMLNLFVEYVAKELRIVQKTVPKWLRWLF